MSYRAPVRDLAFALEAVAGIDQVAATGAFIDYDADVMGAVLEAAGQFSEQVLAPLNRPGDLAGAKYANGAVTAAPGFVDAYKQFAEGGWTGLTASVEAGGQALPKALELAAYETVHAANMAFGLCPMLSLASIEALEAVGTEYQKATYLTKLVSGEWTGAMVLTEPHAGSDLGALTTTATPNGDGTYALNGQKIFITWGDHDATDNIVHLVLARLPDAPAGPKGISLFLTPKFAVNADGSLGERNAFHPVGVEHKLGIHASPTCVMAYEGARAELVGRPNEGLAHMFVMMNAARLAVGVEGVGVAERAYQHALAYALERRQGRSIWTGEKNAPIFDHPDVRRTLGVMKAKIAAARAICLSTGVAADLAKHAAAEADRKLWKGREDLFTPIAKAWSTDVGCEVASLGVQVHGGMGFIEETGAAQYYRDARITPIYEGTNGIQAMDLVGRKLSMDGGDSAKALIADMKLTLAQIDRLYTGKPVERLATAIEAVEDATLWLLDRKAAADGAADVLAGADAYLKLMGDVVGGWMLAKGALAAKARLDAGNGDPVWLQGKLDLYEIYAANVLGHVSSRLAAVGQGGELLEGLTVEALAG
ncbi:MULTISPECIES: acyl-CoA dehydrogenase [unclassified Brevundimonas]|uniref:acyl-CoA dehydrogenase n=1 Tax=unclassified Brevundimonas TaxID=2622653 RepID=UPI000CFDD041|nr:MULTISPECIES: acyl-CoA dehydrogenase [unclassified Brevundimonas]PRA33623.1 acyl-CoA dehydrogenase [Brevundimonas sp. MYb27]PQZ81838.1 acyl-CoA dehydrogenase [Brevundimonas sp. MYb31]PRB13412.1 acyl-CoA dehydrogenase [Brevundimonas sp. MYb52]PRB34062.1 acyl-CoA dehydrogenase [Brevundimonas sp. MYb46]PRB52749.1 acyl-CoA dehydrogenase [Brevundimonas sp. MYb33]